MGRAEDAVSQFSDARLLYGRSIGAESPLYGSACEGLAKALIHAERYQEGWERLQEAFLNYAEKDAIHPTPIFEILGYALDEVVNPGHLPVEELQHLEGPIEIAVKNMVHRGLDQDGNAGVVFERMAQALVRCSTHQGDVHEQEDAARRRKLARYLLVRAAPLVEATTESGEADLAGISTLISMELQILDSQDALYQKVLGSSVPAALALP